nr:reverse transcriptase domain-containing protein [Tanacetum cinerariifolium]
MEVLTYRSSVMTNLWEVQKTKKPTMPTKVTEEEDIKETTTSTQILRPPLSTMIVKMRLEADKEVEPSSSKQAKSNPPPLEVYKPKIVYPQRLRKEKMEEHYAKIIDLIKEVRINVPLFDVC